MKKIKGFFLAFIASIFWGVSGVCAQFLFQERGLNATWLVAVRLLAAGMILLPVAMVFGYNPWHIWKNRKDALALVLFGSLGVLSVQYTYIATIEFSNAATATILQYVGPAMIFAYLALKNRTIPNWLEWLSVLLSISGIFLLVTHGDLSQLLVTPQTLVWGIFSAFALAFYTLQPMRLMAVYPPAVLLAWGFLIGGITLSIFSTPVEVPGVWDEWTFINLGYIIVCGTILSFLSFMLSVKWLGAKPASLIATTEPIAASIVAVIWMDVPFGPIDWLACLLIVGAIVLLTAFQRQWN
jgi:drug/metabolite transporter (DMT)-like permease